MTADEIGVMLNLRATLSEYEHFMCELSAMIERGVDVPPCGVAKFPMREKLYGQVRDLVLGSKAIDRRFVNVKEGCWSAQEPDENFQNILRAGDSVYWSYLDEKRTGVIEHVSEDGSAAVVIRDNGERENIPTFALKYRSRNDGK